MTLSKGDLVVKVDKAHYEQTDTLRPVGGEVHVLYEVHSQPEFAWKGESPELYAVVSADLKVLA